MDDNLRNIPDQEINTDLRNPLDNEMDNVLHIAFEVYLQLILTVILHVIQMIIQHLILADPVQYWLNDQAAGKVKTNLKNSPRTKTKKNE